ncbi:MAG: 50S ribosome-binding GTPase [Acidimicrobiia bacterium]|nr:50S ribosome-binding GTPase [Acidimicrobiia bacterium]
MADLRTLADLIDVCLARSEGVVDDTTYAELTALGVKVRQRSGFVGEVVVIALAGGTGSGKSSLLNALCRTPVARVSIERPTTSRSLAAVPSSSPADLNPLMDALGIDDVVEVDALEHTVIVDLPDFDSTFVDHRAIVERILGAVDAVAWVFDPEKYADRLVHDVFLRPLRPYADQMVFVLNQADRLGSNVKQVVESARLHLVADGYTEPEVVTTIALATESVDLDTSQLETAIAGRFDAKRSVIAKLATEVGEVANRLWKRLGDQPQRTDLAVARATLVSLGVAAAETRHRLDPKDD